MLEIAFKVGTHFFDCKKKPIRCSSSSASRLELALSRQRTRAILHTSSSGVKKKKVGHFQRIHSTHTHNFSHAAVPNRRRFPREKRIAIRAGRLAIISTWGIAAISHNYRRERKKLFGVRVFCSRSNRRRIVTFYFFSGASKNSRRNNQ